MPVRITIDPRFRVSYASYYIEGIKQCFGKKHIDFTQFLPDQLYENQQDYNKGFSFLHGNSKVFIDFDDSSSISTKHYEWCDLYAKINVCQNDLERFEKLKPIGPSFGINILSLGFIKVLLKVFRATHRPVGLFQYIKDYAFLMVRRRKFQQYLGSQSESDYVFSISTLWYDPLTAETTNKLRGSFLETCQRIFKISEGGFFYINQDQVIHQFPQYKEYEVLYKDFLYTHRLSPDDYITKTKRSCLVFNTPSVQGCLGWKLGEYFAMGKAIISSPLHRVMPGKIENTFLNADNAEQMEKAMLQVKNNDALRKILENNASAYFQEFLSPQAVIRSISKALD